MFGPLPFLQTAPRALRPRRLQETSDKISASRRTGSAVCFLFGHHRDAARLLQPRCIRACAISIWSAFDDEERQARCTAIARRLSESNQAANRKLTVHPRRRSGVSLGQRKTLHETFRLRAHVTARGAGREAADVRVGSSPSSTSEARCRCAVRSGSDWLRMFCLQYFVHHAVATNIAAAGCPACGVEEPENPPVPRGAGFSLPGSFSGSYHGTFTAARTRSLACRLYPAASSAGRAASVLLHPPGPFLPRPIM